MARSNRTSRRVRHIGAGIGMAGAAAIISLAAPVAHADDLTPLLDLTDDTTPVNTDLLGILGEAGAKFTEANAVLNEVPAIGTPDETELVNIQLADVQFQLNGLPLSGPDAPDVGGNWLSYKPLRRPSCPMTVALWTAMSARGSRTSIRAGCKGVKLSSPLIKHSRPRQPTVQAPSQPNSPSTARI
jgi:hypothetical protein